jgi:hypothetical protein
MTQEPLLYLLMVITLTASIIVQIIVCCILRELFYYMRGSHKGMYERMDYIVGSVDSIKEQQGHLHKRLSEVFRIVNSGGQKGGE